MSGSPFLSAFQVQGRNKINTKLEYCDEAEEVNKEEEKLVIKRAWCCVVVG